MAYIKGGKQADLEKLSDVCELDMPDRRELDDAVLEMIGVESKKRRNELIDRLYNYLREYFEEVRQKEEIAIANKKRANRKGAARPGDIARQIFEEISENESWILRQYSTDFINKTKPFETFDIPLTGIPESTEDIFGTNGIKFLKGKKHLSFIETKSSAQSKLIGLLASSGVRGLIRIPLDEKECRRIYREYEELIDHRQKRILEFIEDRTADEEMQEKIFEAIMPMILKQI
jgi:hypothetical protein